MTTYTGAQRFVRKSGDQIKVTTRSAPQRQHYSAPRAPAPYAAEPYLSRQQPRGYGYEDEGWFDEGYGGRRTDREYRHVTEPISHRRAGETSGGYRVVKKQPEIHDDAQERVYIRSGGPLRAFPESPHRRRAPVPNITVQTQMFRAPPQMPPEMSIQGGPPPSPPTPHPQTPIEPRGPPLNPPPMARAPQASPSSYPPGPPSVLPNQGRPMTMHDDIPASPPPQMSGMFPQGRRQPRQRRGDRSWEIVDLTEDETREKGNIRSVGRRTSISRPERRRHYKEPRRQSPKTSVREKETVIPSGAHDVSDVLPNQGEPPPRWRSPDVIIVEDRPCFSFPEAGERLEDARSPATPVGRSASIRRSPRRRRSRRASYDSEVISSSPTMSSRSHLTRESDSDSDAFAWDYDFSLPANVKSFVDDKIASNLESDTSDERAKRAEDSASAYVPQHDFESKTTCNVLHSCYPENGASGGQPVAALRIEQESGLEKSSSPFFKWIHYKYPIMHFTAFMESVANTPGLSSTDRKFILSKLKGIQKQSEKPLRTQKGAQGKYLEPVFMQELSFSTQSSTKKAEPDLTLLCLPYFCLERYSENVLPEGSVAHPSRTLLQTLFPSVRKDQDLQQAVRKLPKTPKDSIIHVSQLWLTTADLLITCATRPMDDLRGDFISVAPELTPDPPDRGTGRSNYLRLSDGGTRLWLLKLHECKSWLRFRAHLTELEDSYWDSNSEWLDVTDGGGTLVRPHDWSSIMRKAENTAVQLTLCSRPHTDEQQILLPEPSTSSPNRPVQVETFEAVSTGGPSISATDNSSKVANKDASPERFANLNPSPAEDQDPLATFHVFSRLVTVPSKMHSEANCATAKPQLTRTWRLDNQLFHKILMEVHIYLLDQEGSGNRGAYRKASGSKNPKSLKDVEDLLEKYRRNSDSDKEWLKWRITFMQDAMLIFKFFFPLLAKGPTISAYWTSVYRIANQNFWMRVAPPPSRYAGGIETAIGSGEAVTHVTAVQCLLSEHENEYSTPLTPPDEFVKAWMHWLMSMIIWEPYRALQSEIHCDKFMELIDSGFLKLQRSFPRTNLAEKEAALPLGIMSLMVKRVVEDFTHPHPDVITSYWDYFNQLSREIEEDPYNRAHQRSISFLRQEVDAITHVLAEQTQILENFQSGLESRVKDNPSPISIEGDRVEDRVIYDCLTSVRGKLAGFRDMRNQLDTLQIWNIQMIDSNKDKQETALYVFTIVTVIFLPLSFVCGFLGMNTSDIRGISSEQWLFWAIGIPLTSFIIIVGLLWVGELGNVWRGFLRLFSGHPYRSAVAAPTVEQQKTYMARAPQPYSTNMPSQGPLIQRHAHPLPHQGVFRDSARVPPRAYTTYPQPPHGRPSFPPPPPPPPPGPGIVRPPHPAPPFRR